MSNLGIKYKQKAEKCKGHAMNCRMALWRLQALLEQNIRLVSNLKVVSFRG